MTTKIKSFNNINILKTQDGIDQVKNYLQNNIVPPHLNARQTASFNRIFHNNHFIVENNKIYYRPSERINLRIVEPNEDKDELLSEIHNDNTLGLSLGLNSFYEQVQLHYIGITKLECIHFLQAQGNYQISRRVYKEPNQTIVSKACNSRWQCDVIYIKPADKKYKFIMNIIDIFSKRIFARGLKKLDAESTTNALHNIINVDCQGQYPGSIQTDNGSEFKDEFHQYLIEHHVHHIYSLPSKPTSNAYVERANLEVRRRIKAGFIKYGIRTWIDRLSEYVENINNQPNKNKLTPNQIWTPGYHPNNNDENINEITDTLNNDQIRNYFKNKYVNIAKSKLRHRDIYAIDDRVRVSLEALYPEIRAIMKNPLERKRLVSYFSTDTYRIHKIYYPRRKDINNQVFQNNITKNIQYAFKDDNNHVLIVDEKNYANKKFYGNELVFVPENSTNPTINDAQARQLNGF